MNLEKIEKEAFIAFLKTQGFQEHNYNGKIMGYLNKEKNRYISFGYLEVDGYRIEGTEKIRSDNYVDEYWSEYKKSIPQAKEVIQEKAILNKEIEKVSQEYIAEKMITAIDIEEWKKKSVFDRIIYFQTTPKHLIKYRRGHLLPKFAGHDKKTLTDEHYKMFQYVEGNIMKTEANIAFLFEWSAVVEESKYFENEVAVRGYLQVKLNGEIIRRPCGGSGIRRGLMDWGDTLEAAITEMTKRGLKSFGFNRDVYSQEIEE